MRTQLNIPAALVRSGFKKVEYGSSRQYKDFPTWEKDGARVSIASEILGESKSRVLRYSADNNEITICAIIVDPAHQGHGKASEILDTIINQADVLGIELYLEPVAMTGYAGLSRDQLVNFYHSRGFVWDENSDRIMRRESADWKENDCSTPIKSVCRLS